GVGRYHLKGIAPAQLARNHEENQQQKDDVDQGQHRVIALGRLPRSVDTHGTPHPAGGRSASCFTPKRPSCSRSVTLSCRGTPRPARGSTFWSGCGARRARSRALSSSRLSLAPAGRSTTPASLARSAIRRAPSL